MPLEQQLEKWKVDSQSSNWEKTINIWSLVSFKPIKDTLFCFWKLPLLLSLQTPFYELKVILVITLVITINPLPHTKTVIKLKTKYDILKHKIKYPTLRALLTSLSFFSLFSSVFFKYSDDTFSLQHFFS